MKAFSVFCIRRAAQSLRVALASPPPRREIALMSTAHTPSKRRDLTQWSHRGTDIPCFADIHREEQPDGAVGVWRGWLFS